MPLQNRVSPFGTIEDVPSRGTFMGNRGGALHDEQRRLGRSRWKGKRWITCVLSFKDRKRTLMKPGKYTELFFLDEPTAFAAGHRPCRECRHADYARFVAAWRSGMTVAADATLDADSMDRALHAARLNPDRTPSRFRERLSLVPDGAMIEVPDRTSTAGLVWRGRVHPWSFDGYGEPLVMDPSIEVEVLTPRPIVAVFGAGYRPAPHCSVG